MKTTTPCMILSTDMPAKHTIIQSQNMGVSMEEVKIGRNIQDTMEYQGVGNHHIMEVDILSINN